MPTMLRTFALIYLLATAPSAFAIPFGVHITSTPAAAGLGTWSLSGPTSAADSWMVGFGGSYSSGADVVAGQYTWSLFGGGIGVGSISWTLVLGGQQIYSGSDSGVLAFYVGDKTGVGVSPAATSVPEPGTLLLMGTGLLAMAFSVRRKRQALSD